MAQVTYTISSDNLPYFVEAFKEDYDERVLKGELEGVTETQYAKDNGFKFLADRTRAYHKQKAANEAALIDITQ